MNMLTDEQKFAELERIFKSGADRELTIEEARHLKWLCGWDMDTHKAFKSIMEAMKEGRKEGRNN